MKSSLRLLVAAALVAFTVVLPRPAEADPPPPKEVPAGCNKNQSTGADGIPVARCYAVALGTATGGTAQRRLAAGPLPTALGPAEIRQAYQLPDAGEGQTVAIVDAYGYENAEADLAVWRAHYGLPACTTDNGCFRKLDQRGGTDYPAPDEGWAMETALDLDAVSAVCPKCDIVLVQGDSANMADLGEAVTTAAGLGVTAISNSYGMNYEHPLAGQFDQYYDHPGIAVTVSSGDDGNVQSYPATSPYVTGVGGTRLTRDGSARGWKETAWDDAGSGCSLYESKPDFQNNVATACDNRASADVSAVADPASGLSVYGTYGMDGWAQVGGTSLSAPLVAAMYALAGQPTPGTYPNRYPYANGRGLADITEGVNGTCGDVLCEAGPGWDGPTGLGAPQGVSALTLGDNGEILGTVIAGGKPLAGATVTAAGANGEKFTATTGTDGKYDLYATVGTYAVTVAKFGYQPGTADGVVVTTGGRVTEDFTLSTTDSRTVSGRVTDGSGQGWPMRAKITIDGYPGGAVRSDPFTGEYSVRLPVGADYTFHVEAADQPGYRTATAKVTVRGVDVKQNLALPIDAEACDAPGYAYKSTGLTENFTGWSGTSPQAGWTVTDQVGNGQTWSFGTPRYTDTPGADASMAMVDSDGYGEGAGQDTTLVSPVVDLTGHTAPQISFDASYIPFPDQAGSVDLSLDGGATWTASYPMPGGLRHFEFAIPAAAGQAKARVRFHYTGNWSRRWQLDNVLIGSRSCAPATGGIVAGVVTDDNTGKPLAGAIVTSEADATSFGVTDSDGYYWLHSAQTGSIALTVTSAYYQTAKTTIQVRDGAVKRADVRLRSGRLSVDRADLAYDKKLGQAGTESLTFTNDGTEPVKVHLGEDTGGFTPLKGTSMATGAADQTVPAWVSMAESAGPSPAPPRQPTPAAAPWADLADYPQPVMDNLAATHDGRVYAVGGTTGLTRFSAGYVYQPATQAWTPIADLPAALAGPAGGFIGDQLYVTGGWTNGGVNRHTYAYDPASNRWTQKADLPGPAAVAGSAIVGGRLYVVGGCTVSGGCTNSDKVYRYDAAADTWSTAPAYPSVVAFLACGGLGDQVVCAGGTAGNGHTLRDVYALGATGWVKRSALPGDLWGGAAATSNGRLQIVGGVVAGGTALTNQAVEYDPATDAWTRLPNANNATYRGAAACGLYTVGGAIGGTFSTWWVQNLSGYGDCGQDVSWLSVNKTDFTVAAGRSVSVRVTADSAPLTRLGRYRARLTVSTDTPYRDLAPVSVTLNTTPPAGWGQIAGSVRTPDGKPVAGATVALCPAYDKATGTCGPTSYTLKTDAAGAWHQWLDSRTNPVQVIAAKDGYTPATRVAQVRKGETVTVDFALAADPDATAAAVSRFLTDNLHRRR
ncbi:carboxypeptidase regulatory-like domain-containing protein [Actinoplanes sp. NPDC049265]|uniref:carboxypeptidase regulatory-like domain-containing protein n=1 Tax=Actinoplanes sp. NPDC049265 TaxID=3363902 RepID=UPI00371E7E78